jgi:hypothetical protein
VARPVARSPTEPGRRCLCSRRRRGHRSRRVSPTTRLRIGICTSK